MNRGSILVVDDEVRNLQLLCATLEAQGYEVRPVLTGAAALHAAGVARPDLILLDISLLDMDGYAVCAALKADDGLADVPVIFISALGEIPNKTRAFSLGAVDYITKPFNLDEVLLRVRAQLTLAQQRADLEQRFERSYQRDLESLRRALALEQQQRLRQTLRVAMLSHDFRIPLTNILSSVNLVSRYADQLDDAQRNLHLYRAETSVMQLADMLDEMMLMAQMESEDFELNFEPVSVGIFIADIVEAFRVAHSELHQLVFVSYVEDDVYCDARLLRQIALNLISNAIKYSPRGGVVRICLDWHRDGLLLIVQDQGIGIPPHDVTRLFEAFQRGSNVGSVTGTGLGLMIVKQAVDLLGGGIDLESQLNIGTTFRVYLPLRTV